MTVLELQNYLKSYPDDCVVLLADCEFGNLECTTVKTGAAWPEQRIGGLGEYSKLQPAGGLYVNAVLLGCE